MSDINSVRNLEILYFSEKNKKIKNLKNDEIFLALTHELYILLIPSKFICKLTKNSLKGFISQRSCPDNEISDSGSNFVAIETKFCK